MAKFLFKVFCKLGRTAGVGKKVTGRQILSLHFSDSRHHPGANSSAFCFSPSSSFLRLSPGHSNQALPLRCHFSPNHFSPVGLALGWHRGSSKPLYMVFYTPGAGSVLQSCPTLCNPMDCVACQIPPSMGFSRQEYRSGLPFPPLGDLPNPGIEPRSPRLQVDFYRLLPPGKSRTLGRWLGIEGKMWDLTPYKILIS